MALTGAPPAPAIGAQARPPQSPQASCPSAPAPDSLLTLAQAIDLALCNNPRTQQSWLAAKVAESQVGLAQAPYRPNVSGEAQLQRRETRNVARPGGAFGLDGAIIFNYLLFDFGGRDGALEQAKATLDAARWTHDATLQSVMQDAVSAYYGLAAAREVLQSARSALESSAQSLEAARARQRAGAATRADVLQAQTAHSQDRLTYTQAEGDAFTAQGVLTSALGLPVDLPLRVIASTEFGAVEVIEREVPALLAIARERRPELLAAQAQVRAARQNVKVQESAERPSLALSGAVGATQSRPGEDPRTGAVGLTLSVPLYTGQRTAYQILLAQRQLEAQISARERLRQDIDLEVWRAYQDLRTQRQAVLSAEDLASSARESYNVALGRYKAGVGTVTDLLAAQAAQARADQQRIAARYGWNLAKSTLARALGLLQQTMFALPPASESTKP